MVSRVVSYFTLSTFLFLFLFTGKIIAEKWASRIIVIAIWLSITIMGLSSGGMQLPLIVLYPLPPVIALVMIGKHAFKITSGVTIVTLVIFILLDLSGYHFDTLPIDTITTRIMRSFWLIFLIVVITITINYYVNKIEHLTLTLQSLAESDYVTGLPSRKMLDEALKREYYRAIRLHKGLSLLFVKVDRLNDLYDFAGQMMGDECLRLVSGAI